MNLAQFSRGGEVSLDICEAIQKIQERSEMKAKRETAYELQDMGLSIDKIARAVKVNLGTVQKWLDERLVTA